MNAGKQFASASPPSHTVQVYLRDNGDGTFNRTTIDVVEHSIVMDVIGADGERIATKFRVAIRFSDLEDFEGANKDVQMREEQARDVTTCQLMRRCVLATEWEAVPT